MNISPGYEAYCEDCRSRIPVPEWDEGYMMVGYECHDFSEENGCWYYDGKIRHIKPYLTEFGLWAFDDANHGLYKELFVDSITEIINSIVDSREPFDMWFSDEPFDGATVRLDFHKADESGVGNWYRCDDKDMVGWLCPALFCYFDEAPETIYIKIQKGCDK